MILLHHLRPLNWGQVRVFSSKKRFKSQICFQLSWKILTGKRGMASVRSPEEDTTMKEKSKINFHYRSIAYDKETVPQTLPDYVNQKGYLSVTDLVSPSWCEFAFHYGILGMRHLPVSQRPNEISTPSGNVIKFDKQVAKEREKVLVDGRKIHEKLEKEIHPVKVQIQTKTKEDLWALRILRLITSLQTLLETGCSREIPIFGFVHGQLVMGVIDEINRRPLTKKLNAYLDETKEGQEKPDSKPLSEFFTPVTIQPKQAEADKEEMFLEEISHGTKRWSSQEEWKKEKRKKEAIAKVTKKSPKKIQVKPNKKNVGPEQPSLSNFFTKNNPPPLISEPEEDKPKERFGYFLEDSKTRNANLLPPSEDQQPARLQCMLYKRLFDGLLLGMVDGNRPQGSNKAAAVLETDDLATPIHPEHLFAFLDLNVSKSLSKAFINDAEDLLNDFGMTLHISSHKCTLVTMSILLSDTLTELARSARQGLGWEDSDSIKSGAIQHHLRLTYRKRKGTFRKTKRMNLEVKRKQPFRSGKNSHVDDEQEKEAENEIEPETESQVEKGEDISVAITLDLGIDDDIQQAAIEDEILRDNGVVIPDSSPSMPKSQQKTSQEDEGSEEKDDTKNRKDPNILGTVDFFHNPYELENYLQDMMRLWQGERQKRGVTIEQSWRCHRCEFRSDCEWREEKGQEELEKVILRQRVDQNTQRLEQQPIGISDLDGKDSDGDDAQMKESTQQSKKHKQTNNESQQTIITQDLDDEDALWSQFEDIASEDFKD